jgi:hypothetical protein
MRGGPERTSPTHPLSHAPAPNPYATVAEAASSVTRSALPTASFT